MFSIDASGFNELSASLTAVEGRIGPEAAVAVRVTALAVERDAKAFAPVDTGFLRNSIGHDYTSGDTSAEAEIGPTAEYAQFVEFGTSRMAPAAFMGPALDRNSPLFAEAIAQAATRALESEGL